MSGAIERLKAAVAGVPRGARFPVKTARGPQNTGQHLVPGTSCDILEAVALVPETARTPVVRALQQGADAVPAGTEVHVQADDVYHLLDLAVGPAA